MIPAAVFAVVGAGGLGVVADPATASTAAAAAPLLSNGGFERPAPGHAGPDGWATTSWGGTAGFAWDDAVVHRGRRSVRIDAATPDDARWVQTVPVVPHTVYRVSGWIRTVGVGMVAGATIGFDGTWTHSADLVGDHGWTYVSADVDSGENTSVTVAARVGYWSDTTTGTAWFDDLALGPVPVRSVGELVDGGFEQPDSARAGPFWWSTMSWVAAGSFSWDDAVAHRGRRSVRIDAATPDDARWVQTVPVVPHTVYRVSGWIRTVGVGPVAGATIGFYDTWTHSPNLTGTHGWTYVSADVDSGENTSVTVAARVGYWSDTTTGTAWFDDLALRPVGAGS